jgi:hypothetical protein
MAAVSEADASEGGPSQLKLNPLGAQSGNQGRLLV